MCVGAVDAAAAAAVLMRGLDDDFMFGDGLLSEVMLCLLYPS